MYRKVKSKATIKKGETDLTNHFHRSLTKKLI
jgi:hypothetical protein